MDMKRWYVGCLVAAVAVAILAGCSDGHGPVEGGGNGSPDVVEKIEAPLFVYEILAEQATDSAGIDILDLLSAPRVEQLLMNHIPEEVAVVQAKYEAAAAFGIDSVQLATDSGAVMLAVSAMVQGRESRDETMNFIRYLGEDLKGDGVWNDPNWKIKIADWVVGLDSSWKYNDVRNNAAPYYGGNVPYFEKYMRAFFPIAYGFEPCGSANAGTVTYVNQGQSVYYANDYEHADHSRVRFICDANGFQWRVANAIEKDTAGFGAGEYDREVREGRVNHDNYYIFDSGKWRVATPQEADGFTDLVQVYANLKADEKVVFIIRHSERTNDTGPSGHLTDNGKKYARDLGARIAKVGTEDFYFGYSGYTRTYETCENIAQGKGQANYSIEQLSYMNGDWYVKDAAKADAYVDSDGGGWVVYSKYGFTGAYSDAFYDLETRSEQLLKDEILANIAGMKRVNVMCTHDYLVVPLLAYTTDGHANVRYFEKYRWVNYMAGVAMIISADGSVRYVPVKGLETGIM
jgi:broad specificity phosphatase PhoE